jgi:hypothetical protein
MADRSARIFDKMHRNRWQISRAAGERAEEKRWAARSGPVTTRRIAPERSEASMPIDKSGESSSVDTADSEATVDRAEQAASEHTSKQREQASG